jgi:excisionase family DNA binding protein
MSHQTRVLKTFCTTREAAQILGVALRTAQLWVESGLLEAWKTEGGHRRISRESIERLLLKQDKRPPQAANTAGKASPERSFSILIVEDEPDLRQFYTVALSRWSMKPQVVTVADGYEALMRIGLAKPDMIITDLRMGGMDGVKMIQSMRSVPELSATAIVVVTGLDASEIHELGGIPDDIPILPKPIPIDRLRDIALRAAEAIGKQTGPQGSAS